MENPRDRDLMKDKTKFSIMIKRTLRSLYLNYVAKIIVWLLFMTLVPQLYEFFKSCFKILKAIFLIKFFSLNLITFNTISSTISRTKKNVSVSRNFLKSIFKNSSRKKFQLITLPRIPQKFLVAVENSRTEIKEMSGWTYPTPKKGWSCKNEILFKWCVKMSYTQKRG